MWWAPLVGYYWMWQRQQMEFLKNFSKGNQIISVSVLKVIILLQFQLVFYAIISIWVSILKIFSILLSVCVLLISIISVSVWVSVTGIIISMHVGPVRYTTISVHTTSVQVFRQISNLDHFGTCKWSTTSVHIISVHWPLRYNVIYFGILRAGCTNVT